MSELAHRLLQLRSRIDQAARRAGRSPAELQLVAVSKTHPPEALLDAIEAGQLLFGESRIQEARAKIPMLPARARWHFIGHLQKNKVRHALALGFELVHSVDTGDLAKELNRLSGETGARPRILLEVNIAGEGTKFGFSAAALHAEMSELLALDRLHIEGLMTIAPFAPEPDHSRKHFARLRELRDALSSEFGITLPHLSMGMSGDFVAAIEEGATLVRIGTAIFGRRSGKNWRPTPDSSTLDD